MSPEELVGGAEDVGAEADEVGAALSPGFWLCELGEGLGESPKLKSLPSPLGIEAKGSSPRLWTPVGVPTLKGRAPPLPPLGELPIGVLLLHDPREPRSSRSPPAKSKPKESMRGFKYYKTTIGGNWGFRLGDRILPGRGSSL